MKFYPRSWDNNNSIKFKVCFLTETLYDDQIFFFNRAFYQSVPEKERDNERHTLHIL